MASPSTDSVPADIVRARAYDAPVSDIDRLLAAFESGELLRPARGAPNLVDLARALATVNGIDDLELTPGAEAIRERIGAPEHLVFVLADGFGMNFLESMPAGAFLRRQTAMELHAVFPSTTAVGLTTLATGEWPSEHAVTGWWTYLREIDGAATVVKFERRSDEKPLNELGIESQQLMPLPALGSRSTRDTLSLFPRAIADSVYSRYATGATARAGYESLGEAVDAVIARIAGADGATYTYLYTPRIDAAAHDYGTGNHRVGSELGLLNHQLERLAAGAGAGTRIVLTADHGHLDVPEEKKHLINRDEELAATLRVAPSYDARVMCFHLRDGTERAFRDAIARRFGDIVFVLSVDEVEALELFGPGPLSPLTRERLGDFVSVTRGADAIGFRPATGGREIMALASQHSGLTPEQMRIPLLIA